jgi:hypothetical protein
MAIRKYTKKRRRRSLRKLRGGTRTIDRVNERKTARIAPDELFRTKNLNYSQPYHIPARYAARPASPPPMTPKARQALADKLAMRRATPSERREFLGTKIASRARAVAARGRRRGEKRFEGLEAQRGLVDRHVDLYFRDITRRELDDAILNLRPTRRSAPRSPPPSTRSAPRSTRSRSATRSPRQRPPPRRRGPRSATRSTRSRSLPRSLRRRSPTPPPRTAWGARAYAT